jgi:hypothetical protein
LSLGTRIFALVLRFRSIRKNTNPGLEIYATSYLSPGLVLLLKTVMSSSFLSDYQQSLSRAPSRKRGRLNADLQYIRRDLLDLGLDRNDEEEQADESRPKKKRKDEEPEEKLIRTNFPADNWDFAAERKRWIEAHGREPYCPLCELESEQSATFKANFYNIYANEYECSDEQKICQRAVKEYMHKIYPNVIKIMKKQKMDEFNDAKRLASNKKQQLSEDQYKQYEWKESDEEYYKLEPFQVAFHFHDKPSTKLELLFNQRYYLLVTQAQAKCMYQQHLNGSCAGVDKQGFAIFDRAAKSGLVIAHARQVYSRSKT